MSKKSDLTVVQVDSVSLHNYIDRKKTAELRIYGYLPNPAYEIHHVETWVEGDEIVVIPWASHDPKKIVIQMNVPFEHLCKVQGVEKHLDYRIRQGDPDRSVLQMFKID
ncbi:hypothetical protein JW992_12525 [candidate division KSB1 bacterium]|nr:hypothetical protein [candidate division KSB1 bacterium]